MDKSKLEIGLLKNQGRLLKPEFELKFNKSFPNFKLEYIDFEIILNIRKNLRLDSANKRMSSGLIDKDGLIDLLNKLMIHIPDQNVLVIFENYYTIGAIELSLHNVLSDALRLIEFDKDAIIIISSNNKSEILLDFDDNSLTEFKGYEVYFRGEWCELYNAL